MGITAVAAVWMLGGDARIALGQQNQAGGVEAVEVVPNFYMIAGAGGNVAVDIGSPSSRKIGGGAW